MWRVKQKSALNVSCPVVVVSGVYFKNENCKESVKKRQTAQWHGKKKHTIRYESNTTDHMN